MNIYIAVGGRGRLQSSIPIPTMVIGYRIIGSFLKVHFSLFLIIPFHCSHAFCITHLLHKNSLSSSGSLHGPRPWWEVHGPIPDVGENEFINQGCEIHSVAVGGTKGQPRKRRTAGWNPSG